MSSEQFKSEILEVIIRWSSENFATVENNQFLTKAEIEESLLDILKTNFGNKEYATEKTLLDDNCSEKMDDHTQISSPKDSEFSLNTFIQEEEQQKDKEEIEEIEEEKGGERDEEEEICRDGEHLNRTATSIEDTLSIESHTTTDIKDAVSPVVLIKDVGRSDTFELKSPNNLTNLSVYETEKKVIDETSLYSAKLKELTKQLEKVQNNVYTLVKSASAVHREVSDMKLQVQEELKKISSQKPKCKSPLLMKMPDNKMPLITTPKSTVTLKRKSYSFSAAKGEKRLPYSPCSSSISPSPILRQSIQKSTLLPQDSKGTFVRPKNPKYAHVQSTIPKATPSQKQTKK